jgi:hypothetical protein
MISSNTTRGRRHISDYFEAIHGGIPPMPAPKPAENQAPNQDEPAKTPDQTPKPKQP